jgi:Spy/CpxP family protein refolding chaperone
MKIIRHRVAAALFAASFAAVIASPAFAAGQADAPPAAFQQGPEGHWHGRGPGGPGGPGFDGGPEGFGEHGPGMHEDGHGGLLRHLHRLNLSEAQQDKLFAIMHAAAPERREHMKAIRKAHEALAELARADRFDDAKASALSRELGQAIAAEALLQARTEAKALAVLTPEQHEQLRRHRTPGPQLRPGMRQGPQDQQGQQAAPAPQARP